jgi:hypothetical protein
MRARRLIEILAVVAAIGCALALVEPLYSGRTGHSYAQERRVIRAGILVSGGYTPSPYAMYLLGSESVYVPLGGGKGFEFYPPRPAGWEVINPVATPGIDKSDPTYWRVGLGGIDLPLLQNFDVLLLPIVGIVNLSINEQRVLERWVDQGGLLWLDNQPDHPNGGDDPQLGDFFLRPRVQFAARDRAISAPKVSVDLTHPLLRGRCPLSEDEVQWLGQQYAYGAVGDPTNVGLSPLDGIVNGVNNPFPPNSALSDVTKLQEVVGELYDAPPRARMPVIAAGYFGDGCIVVSACGIASGISDWYAGLAAATPSPQTALELPQWALPDMKFAYNMIQWWMDWAGTHGRVRFRGEYEEEASGPPVLAWDDIATLSGALSGPAVVGRGLAFAGSSTGVLAGWDVEPLLDRDLDHQSDDGTPDYALGSARDVLWSVTVPWQDPSDEASGPPARDPAEPVCSVVGAPALNTIYDDTGPRRLVAAAVRTEDGLDSSLHAYFADPTDGVQANPAWSATIKHYSVADPAASNGLVSSGPVAADEFFALVTTDSGTLDAPNRDAHLLIYDAAGPGALPATPTGTYSIPYEQPAVHIEMAEGGRAATFGNPPAIAMAGAWDQVLPRWEAVQAAVLVGNSLPRPGPSATGRLWVTPLMVRFPAPGWDRTWLVDPAQPDTAANQSVTVSIPDAGGSPVQVPPHMDDDPAQPLNYIRSTVSGQVRIVFSRWSLFARGHFPLGFQQVQIGYRDTTGATRTLTQKLHPGFPVALGGYVSEAGYATPCVFENDIFVGTDAVNAYPNPSSEGRLAAYSVHLDGATGPNWTFFGDRYRGEDPNDPARTPGYYFSSFSFTPTYAQETLFAVGNYQFFRREEDQQNEAMPQGPSGALYALELKASPELVNPGTADPVFASPIDSVAPRNDGVNPGPFSADPNQVVLSGRAGTAVWISTNTNAASSDYNSPRYAIPQVAGATINWRVDFPNRIIRLGAGAFGRLASPVWSDMGTAGDPSDDRYVPQRVRVRYFSGGVIQDTVMEVTPLVKWLYIAPDGWEFISSPVVANGMVMVVAYDHANARCLLLGFRAVPEDIAPGKPLWAHPAEPEYVEVLATGITFAQAASLAVAEKGLVWSVDLAGVGTVAGLRNPATVIADNDRLLAADPGGVALTSQESVSHSRDDSTTGAAGIPVGDSYAERMFEPLDRPRRVRALPNRNLLVVDAGANHVLELDPDGDVVWRYPNDDPAANLGGMTADQARLLAPSDAHRYYYRQFVPGNQFNDPGGIIQATDTVTVDWASTLIADAGNYRVLEVARPLLDGRYRPEVTDAGTGAAYAEIVREIASTVLTAWPTASGTTSVQAAFTTAERFAGVDGTKLVADATYPYLSANIMCAVGNHPADPLGKDQYVRLVEVGISYGAGAQAADSAVTPRLDGTGAPEGINVFRPRTSPWTAAGAEQVERDFLNIRQADQAVVPDPGTGLGRLCTLVVDDVGVKLVDNATWNTVLEPVFEMRGPAPWLHDANAAIPGDYLTTYEEEIAGGAIVGTGNQPTRAAGQVIHGLDWALTNWVSAFGDPTTTGVYPPLIREPRTGFTLPQWEALRAAAWNNVRGYSQGTLVSGRDRGEAPFLPVFAKRQPNGKYLVVNAYPNPYLSQGPLDVMAPITSEVFEVDPAQPVGQRIFNAWDEEAQAYREHMWSHFVVPDPARSEYPALRGGAGPLRQPWAVERW